MSKRSHLGVWNKSEIGAAIQSLRLYSWRRGSRPGNSSSSATFCILCASGPKSPEPASICAGNADGSTAGAQAWRPYRQDYRHRPDSL